jgi:dipeptidyl aminopeptidase/acylaminoacyl peptidase
MKLSTLACVVIICIRGIFVAPGVFAVEQLPIKDFFKESNFGGVALSPDGGKIAVSVRYKERLALALIDIKTKQPRILTAPENFDVAGIMWVGNNRIIFSGIVPGDKFLPKRANGGIYAIDADGKNSRTLLESVDQQTARGVMTPRFGSVLGPYGKSTEEILITYNANSIHEPDVYRLNVRTGSKIMVLLNPGEIAGYLFDHEGVVRLGYGYKGLNRFLMYRDSSKDKMKETRRWKTGISTIAEAIEPMSFDQDNKLIYVKIYRGDSLLANIALYDPQKDEIVKELFENDTYDINDVILSNDHHKLLGYLYEGERGMETVFVEKRQIELQEMLKHEFLGMNVSFISSSDDMTWVVLVVRSDRDPGTCYILNTKELTMEKLVRPRDWINPAQMAEMRPIQFKARDGLTMHGYLTMPVGVEPRGLPLIVNPHGGPWRVRDEWGFNPEVQFLANRGYAVLQINFRISAGYGKKFEYAGYGQWGLAMQDDLTDGVKWAIAQGYADPKRIAIYGASYGGFATMAGLAFTPELYRCGINYVGVTDVKLLLKRMNPGWEISRDEIEAMAGYEKGGDNDILDKASPMKNADLIKAPVFFAYGELDPRVDLKHGTRFISKLKSNGIPIEVMIKNNEEHGFRDLRNQVEFYSTMERFLAKYMN